MDIKGQKADTSTAYTSGCCWSFAGREFDESRLELSVNGKLMELELKPLEILIHLLRHAGEIVTKDQLLEAVWPGLEVVEGSLTTAVYKLRKALCDDDAAIVVTVPRIGYRLAASVQPQTDRSTKVSLKVPFAAGSAVPSRAQWRLIRPMEASPHSEVWLAEHEKTHEWRVFKFATNASRLKSLRREVTVYRYLRESAGDRPEFVRILEWNFDKQPFFVESEYGGQNLAEWADKRGGLTAIPLEERICLAVRICQAIAIAHAAGVLHRDLKQANILIGKESNEKEQVKIVDFGSASLVDPDRLQALGITNLGFTQTANLPSPVLTGTLMYLAPETFSGQRPTALSDVYALGVLLYQLVIGDFRKPMAPGWEANVPDPILQEDIAQVVCGDPSQRLARPAELAERLLHLDQRRLERQRIEEDRVRELTRQGNRMKFRARIPWLVSAAVFVVAVIIVLGTLHFLGRPLIPKVQTTSQVKTVAVLPFQDIGQDHSFDYLRTALADEIATTLSYDRGIAIRPFQLSGASGGSYADPQKSGLAMGVRTVVTGHFLKQGNQIEITIEALGVETKKLLWRDTIDLPSDDLIQMNERVTSSIRDGLAPVLGSSSNAAPPNTRPQDGEAYQLYLRSLALPDDSLSNRQAIDVLKHATRLEPNYAPAWSALAVRYYKMWSFNGGGNTAIRKSEDAAVRAQKLNPGSVIGGSILVRIWTENGQLLKAYEEAIDLVKRRPDSGYAHFALSYVLIYAGLLKEAARQCEFALSTDPHNPEWRSCVPVYEQLGDFQRASEFLALSPSDSPWTRPHLIQEFVREGKNKAAEAVGTGDPPGWESYTLLQACAANRPAAEINALAKSVVPSRDSELNYAFAAHFSYCHKMVDSIRFLKLSIQGGHCPYPGIETDPLMANLRAQPEYPALRAEALDCQQNFLAGVREQNLPAP